jgi:HAE1 family hydrophobic/amphiphilic exporter-1
MKLYELAIKRPTFVTCIFLMIVVVGGVSLLRLGVDLFPAINFPIVSVTTLYPGAGPQEMEELVTKPLEDALSTIAGIKNIKATNKEGVSQIVLEFSLSTESKYAEQQAKDRIALVRNKLPDEVLNPMVRAIDFSEMPILMLAFKAEKSPPELYDLADQILKPLLQQVNDVGLVEINGGRKKEIQVLLDRDKLQARNLSASAVAMQLSMAGKNVPAGKTDTPQGEAVVRTLGEYSSLAAINSTVVTFFANETPTKISDIATVREDLEEEKTRTFVDGAEALTINVFRRSGANTVAVANAVKKQIEKINLQYKDIHKGFILEVVQDGARPIENNLIDVGESILLGILLTVVVVFLFLGSARSTLITGIALPNSLLGAFILMAAAGFTINTMTLLALSLAVGLLIDDAIVVRENIFRHIEEGMPAMEAARHGTQEVVLAVVATTLTVLAVFGPVAFLQGVVGQFFKEFGLTVCFAMIISLFDALTMAPMLSAYFAGRSHRVRTNIVARASRWFFAGFNRLQDRITTLYVALMKRCVRHSFLTLLAAFGIFVGGFFALSRVPKTFLPEQDIGEFVILIELTPGTSLEKTAQAMAKITEKITAHKEVAHTVVSVGGRNGEVNAGEIYLKLVPSKQRGITTSKVKALVRDEMHDFAYANPRVVDRTAAGPQQPLVINISGPTMEDTRGTAEALFARLKHHEDLKDVNISYREGKPEFQVVVDKNRAQEFGVAPTAVGQELRTQIEGATPAVYRHNGNEYEIRVRFNDTQKNIRENFKKIFVPNLNGRLVKLESIAEAKEVMGPATIERWNRSRSIQVSAAINPEGKGLGHALDDIKEIFANKEIVQAPGVEYQLIGQAANFQELLVNMMIAAGLAMLFIYLVLASLYESFITPFTIMLVLPLAICGAFYALWITHASFDIFSMIGCVMLLGVATKNSILLVDYTNQQLAKGMPLQEAILYAGKVRLRPIIMTTLALIAGMLPVAIGLNEASKQRTSMGIAVIGGLISSTLLTLVVVPAAYAYIEAFRRFVDKIKARVVTK